MFSILIIVGGVLLRLVPHIPNFAPISAMALFGGVYLKKKYAITIPLVAMILSDYLLLYINPFRSKIFDFSHFYPLSAMFHSTTIYVWGSFLISGLIGIWMRNKKSPSNVVFSSLAGSIQFFLITNFGVWATGMYSRGMDGLIQSYIMGIPFFKWTLFGDLFYTSMFFMAYELALYVSRLPKDLAKASYIS